MDTSAEVDLFECDAHLIVNRYREEHLRKVHNVDPKDYEPSYAKLTLSTGRIFATFSAWDQASQEVTKCDIPLECMACKICGNKTFFTCIENTPKNHIRTSKDAEHKRLYTLINNFGSYYGVVKYLAEHDIQFTPMDILEQRSGYKCPKCTFIAGTAGQVASHIAQSH